MIGKAKSIAHAANAIDYALKKDQAEIIDKRMVVGESGNQVASEFRVFQDLNHHTTNNSISIVLSPDPQDGRQLTNDEYRDIATSFLKEMQLDGHQAIVVKHSDRDHAHLHIVCNRIDPSGKAYKDNYIGKKAQNVADRVARDADLIRARVVQEMNREQNLSLKKEIYQLHKNVMKQRPTDLKHYTELMAKHGIRIDSTVNSGRKLQGFRVNYGGKSFKASEINRSMTLAKMVAKTIAPGVFNPVFKVAKIVQKSLSR